MQFILRQVVLFALLLSAVPAFGAGGRWSTLGPDGGTVFALAVDPGDPRIVYAGTQGGGGVFKSYDAGETWEPASAGLPRDAGGHVTALAVDPVRRTTLWAGTRGFGVWKSTDAGASWSRSLLPEAFAAKNVVSLAVDPRTPDVVYAGTEDGLFKTTNGGAFWNATASGLPPPVWVTSLAVDPSRTNIVYAGHLFDGVFKSTDAGESWAESGRGIAGNSGATALEIHPRQTATVFAGIFRGVARSNDRGSNWSPAAFLADQDRILDLAVHPRTPKTAFAGAFLSGAWRSDDGGAGWSPINAGLTSPQVRALVFDAATGALYAGAEGEIHAGGVFKSTDGRTWRRTVEGLKAIGVSAVAVEPDGTLWTATGRAGGQLGLHRSGDGGLTWTLNQPDPNVIGIGGIAADPSRPGTVYAQAALRVGEVFSRALFKTTDSGRTWTRLPAPPFDGFQLEADPRGLLLL